VNETEQHKWECWARYVLNKWEPERIEKFLRTKPGIRGTLREILNYEKAKQQNN
jgi:hypothetical protein